MQILHFLSKKQNIYDTYFINPTFFMLHLLISQKITNIAKEKRNLMKNLILKITAAFALITCIGILLSLSYCRGLHPQKSEGEALVDTICVEQEEEHIEPGYHLYFLGQFIDCPKDSLYQKLKKVYANDQHVNFDPETGNIEICGTLFHINQAKERENSKNKHLGFMLNSSVKADSEQMGKVKDYIIKHHGADENAEGVYSVWHTDLKGKNPTTIMMRGVHTGEGGTFISISEPSDPS